MFWRKRIEIPEPNVPADWVERSLWQLWGPPSNHIAGEASYQTALAAVVGATCDAGYWHPGPGRLHPRAGESLRSERLPR